MLHKFTSTLIFLSKRKSIARMYTRDTFDFYSQKATQESRYFMKFLSQLILRNSG